MGWCGTQRPDGSPSGQRLGRSRTHVPACGEPLLESREISRPVSAVCGPAGSQPGRSAWLIGSCPATLKDAELGETSHTAAHQIDEKPRAGTEQVIPDPHEHCQNQAQ